MHQHNPAPPKTPLAQKIILIIFSIFLSLLLLETGLRLGGFIVLSLQRQREIVPIKQKGIYRIMCLGESTTFLGGEESYPSQLQEVLNRNNLGLKFRVINKGMSCIDTGIILAHLEQNLDSCKPDMVIAMMGINDEGIKYYEGISDVNSMLFKNLRIYRYARFIWKQIVSKAKGEIKKQHKEKDNPIRNEGSLKKDIAMNPKNDWAYIELARFYRDQGNMAPVEDLYKKAIGLNPKNDWAYIELAKFYRSQGKIAQVEELYKKAIGLNPKNDLHYIELGKFYWSQGKIAQTEELLKKDIKLNPGNFQVYFELGWLYIYLGKTTQTEELIEKGKGLIKKSIELNPKNDMAYIELGRIYLERRQYPPAEELLKKALEVNPGNDYGYVELGWVYLDQGKFTEAEELFKKAIELNPNNDKAFAAMAMVYAQMGKKESFREYLKKTSALRKNGYNPATAFNYRKLKEVLDARKIRLVCAQYPMRSIEPLKKIFEGSNGVIFADSEAVFKEAVQKSGFKEYFVDMFGGDFGHCTLKGNRLLAENIARVILKEVFNK